MPIQSIIVTGLPNEPGAILPGHDLIAAFRIAAEAKAAGLEGKVFLVEDGQVKELNRTSKQRGEALGKTPWSP
jgi:hypothetical protein